MSTAMNATAGGGSQHVGIISTPNQPTYRRLLVEVTHSQKDCQPLAPERC